MREQEYLHLLGEVRFLPVADVRVPEKTEHARQAHSAQARTIIAWRNP